MPARFKLYTISSVVSVGGGAPVPLSGVSLLAQSVSIQSDLGNTASVAVGGDTVAPSTGMQLSAGDSCQIEPPNIDGTVDQIDLSEVYISSATAGQVVRVSYMAKVLS